MRKEDLGKEKMDYIIKSLSKTEKKDFENYVINRIWNKLDNSDIEFVTQQCVHKKTGKYYLIDLYFPSLNIAIECKENYHKRIIKKDSKREKDILHILSSIEYGDNLRIISIEEEPSLQLLNKRIDDVVKEIKESYKRINPPKWSLENQTVLAKNNGKITVADNYKFRTIVDIASLFGKEYKMLRRCAFDLDDDYIVWCPKLAIGNDVNKPRSKKWSNTYSKDRTKIYEYYTEGNIKDKFKPKKYKKKRIVFAYNRDIFGKSYYSFFGIYKFKYIKENTAVHELIKTEILL